jgi:hypothetical protein
MFQLIAWRFMSQHKSHYSFETSELDNHCRSIKVISEVSIYFYKFEANEIESESDFCEVWESQQFQPWANPWGWGPRACLAPAGYCGSPAYGRSQGCRGGSPSWSWQLQGVHRQSVTPPPTMCCRQCGTYGTSRHLHCCGQFFLNVILFPHIK